MLKFEQKLISKKYFTSNQQCGKLFHLQVTDVLLTQIPLTTYLLLSMARVLLPELIIFLPKLKKQGLGKVLWTKYALKTNCIHILLRHKGKP